MWHPLSSLGVWSSFAWLGLSAVLYVVIVSVYRLTLHPLAKFPGPFLYKVSGWALFYQTTTGNRHLEQLKEHEKYGPIVRIGPNAVSINTPSALKEIYSNRRANIQKSQWYHVIDASSGDYSTHSEIDRTKHAARRRVLDHAFSENALRSSEPFIVENVDNFCRLISALPKNTADGQKSAASSWTEQQNMSMWSTYLNYDIMGDLVFGKRFNCMTSEEHRFIPRLMMEGMGFIYSLAYLPFRNLMHRLLASGILAYIGGESARNERVYVEYAQREMTERLAQEDKKTSASTDSKASRKDIAHYLINATDPVTGKGFTRAQLDADSSLLIAAGADTTSTTLSAAVFYLLHNPTALETLTQEIRTSFPTLDAIRATPGSPLTKLPYLRACIDETLRMAPPVLSILPREVVADGITISIPTTTSDSTTNTATTTEVPHFFPAGTELGTSAYCIHHNATYFPSPFAFRPERWIESTSPGEGATKDSVSLARSAFCAFSLGARGCVGKTLAYMELQLTLARMLYVFDIRLATANKDTGKEEEGRSRLTATHPLRFRADEFQLEDRFLAARDGPMVEFRRRVGEKE